MTNREITAALRIERHRKSNTPILFEFVDTAASPYALSGEFALLYGKAEVAGVVQGNSLSFALSVMDKATHPLGIYPFKVRRTFAGHESIPFQGNLALDNQAGDVASFERPVIRVTVDSSGTVTGGITVIAGPKGEQGPQGLRGEKGETGPTGEAGPQGIPGDVTPAFTTLAEGIEADRIAAQTARGQAEGLRDEVDTDATAVELSRQQVEDQLAKIDGFSIEKSTGRANLYIPLIPYAHPRGSAEIAGNGVFNSTNYYGFGLYELLEQGAVFNRIEAGVRSLLGSEITLNVYTSKTYTANIPSMTLLYTKVYAAGTFNTAAGVGVFDLDNSCLIAPGEYVYIVFHSLVDNDLQITKWGVAAATPSRHPFLLATGGLGAPATHWTKTWGVSNTGAGFFQAGIRLSNIQDFAQYEKLKGVISPDGNGKVKNIFLESAVYNHPRGDAEMLGNSAYNSPSAYGSGVAVQMSDDVVFNAVEIGSYVVRSGATITAKILSGPTFTTNVSNLTTLITQAYKSEDILTNRAFNTTQKLIFDVPVKVAAGNWVYVLLASDIPGALYMRTWNTAGSGPVRDRYLYTTTPNPWATTWGQSGGIYYAAAIKLRSVNPFSERRILELGKKPDPRIVIPSKIHLTVGREKSLYYDALVFGKDIGYNSPADWNVVVACAKGTSRHRYWRFTPAIGDIGDTTITVYVYDNQGLLLASKSSLITVSAAEKPATEMGVCMIGDSTVADANSRVAINESFAAIGTGATPVFVGSAGGSPTKSEGWSGSKWEGHVQQTMAWSGGTRNNAFWNPNTSQLDISYYKSTVIAYANSIKVVDIRLGINNMRGTLKDEAYFQTVMGYAKTLVGAWLAHDSATRVIVQLPLSDMNSNWGNDKFTYRANMRRLWEYIIETFDNGAYNARVFVGDVGLCVDRYYGYQVTTVAAGYRYTETDTLHDDNVHPRSQGYKEAGDAAFPTILWALRQ